MDSDISEKRILHEVILGYRNVLNERYQYENLKGKYDLPITFNEARISLFRNYFLDCIYPLPEKREELNEAFEHLDDYIRHPEKLLRILIDSGGLLFKYGRHLPKIFKAGIKTFRLFRAATKFENTLVKNALSNSLSPPYSNADIYTLFKALSLEEIDQFIENNLSLFAILHDRILIQEIKEIVKHLVKKMKQRPKSYSPQEIRGLEIGLEIIEKGDFLFDQLSKQEQLQVFDFIVKIERDVIKEIFSN
jgi:hypothetical protein